MENIAKLTPFEKIDIVRKAPNLTSTQKLILLTIATHLGNNDFCWLSYSTLMFECSLKKRNAISDNLKKLVEIGYLIIKEPNEDYSSNQYEINFEVIKNVQPSNRRLPDLVTVGYQGVVTVGYSKEQILNNKEITVFNIAHEHAFTNIETEDVHPNEETNMSKIYTSERFDEFWSIYPRRQGKKRAKKIWEIRNLDDIADRIITDVLEKCKHEKQWKDKQFIPHASTYLHGERWNDEIIEENSNDQFNVGDYLVNKVRRQYERKNEKGMDRGLISEVSNDLPKKMVREFY